MEDLHFKTQEHLDAFLSNLQSIGHGSEGDCYKLDSQTVLKYLNGPSYEPLTREQILQFSDINICNYIFIKNIVYLQDEIVGVLMKYIDGKNIFDHRLHKTKYDNILKAFEDLMGGTRKLSDSFIHIVDPYSTNIIYKNKKFYIVDTMGYKIDDRIHSSIVLEKQLKSTDDIYTSNIRMLSFQIYNCLLTRLVKHYLVTIPDLRNYERNKDFLENPVLFLNIVKNKLSEYCEEEIKTVEQADKVLKKRR